jgi:hypothetical protein
LYFFGDMTPVHLDEMKTSPEKLAARQWLDRLWWLWLVVLLGAGIHLFRTGYFCRYPATDFRGYYASAQIAWQQGFARVYDQPTQDAYQSRLPFRCLDGTYSDPLLRVSMPYLPAFAALLLPLPALEFTTSYLFWTLLSLLVLVFYSWYFVHSLTGAVNGRKLFQWMICLPLFANLALGQMNVFLVVCLGEFTLALIRGKELRGGFWLAGMLLKPHSLILFLPGLVVARRWKVLAGFLSSAVLLMAGSYLLAGRQGIEGMFEMIVQFASPEFTTAPTMMNWRALALNMQAFSPAWLAWGIALAGMLLAAVLCLMMWRSLAQGSAHGARPSGNNRQEAALTKTGSNALPVVFLVLATYAACASIAWHSHFYMLLPVIPLLIYLDCRNKVPTGLVALWIWGPFLFYGFFTWIAPSLARNALGLGMLGLNLVFFAWLCSLTGER